MRNRILAAFLCISLVLCSAGCKNRQSQTSENQTSQPDAVQKEKQRSNVMEYDDQIGEYYYLIGDFENYFECSQVKYTGGRMAQIDKRIR